LASRPKYGAGVAVDSLAKTSKKRRQALTDIAESLAVLTLCEDDDSEDMPPTLGDVSMFMHAKCCVMYCRDLGCISVKHVRYCRDRVH
jgi:uncharacterized protein YgfB (UPF0149 family)